MYARKLTKEELMKSGITEVTKDCRVFRGDTELKHYVNNQGYFMVNLFEFDEDGNRIFMPYESSVFGGTYKMRSVGLHRVMWAWFYNEVPEGMVVDHISNEHDKIEDYYLTNLQLLTPAENLSKERPEWNTSEVKCQLSKPRSFYEEKLECYTLAYEQAKKNHDAEGAHRFRTSLAQTRARLRYYDSHIEEAQAIQKAKEQEEAKKKAYHEIAQKKRELKAKVDSARKYYKEIRDAYGKDDPYVQQLWGEWKLAIAMLYGFMKENGSNA